jgi:phosphatidylserine decarboxylase
MPSQPISSYEPIVQDLDKLIQVEQWTKDFYDGIENATKLAEVDLYKAQIILDPSQQKTVESFLGFCNRYLKWVPTTTSTSDEALWMLSVFYFVFDQPSLIQYQNPIKPGESSNKPTKLSQWLHDYANALGKWMDTSDSGAHVATFSLNPEYSVYQYQPGDWSTFNKFFARSVKPEYRPISPVNTVASPCDAKFDGYWPIAGGNVNLKGIDWSVKELLADSKYSDQFNEGIFMHSFLLPHNYHHVHAPVSGSVVERKIIPGNVYLEVDPDEGNGLKPIRRIPQGDDDVVALDNPGYQWNQVRALWVFDTTGNKDIDIGYVALFAVGMAQISSVNFSADGKGKEKGTVRKGDDIAYLKYGGSDYILLFQKDKVNFDPESPQKNTLYLMGAALVSAICKK